MKITFITTVNHNVGDDFVREGNKYLLRQYFKERHMEFESIHKHAPVSTRYGFEWLRSLTLAKAVDKIMPKTWTRDRVLEADILVQSGTPVYWCHKGCEAHCSRNEWFSPLVRERFQRTKRQKLLNLAAGTCQKYHSDGSEFCQQCNSYIKEFYDLAAVTTVRDSLAQVVLANLSRNVNVIPCSSIFAVDEYGLESEGAEYVVVNYMRGGAHYTFGQNIDFDRWQMEFEKFYFDLKKREKVIVACHSQNEVDDALSMDPRADIFFQKHNHLAYMKFYSKAKFGIMNRVHGALLMASFGKPSLVIGNDSRAKMAMEMGLKVYFVGDVDHNLLNEEYEVLKNGCDLFCERSKIIKRQAFKDYMKALSVL